MDKRIKAKISENTSYKNDGASQISIAYSTRKIDNAEASYQILSELISGDDVIIELDSSLLNISENENKVLVSDLINEFENLGIEYKKKKVSLNVKKSILSIMIDSKKRDGFEFTAYIPHEIWCSQEFKNIIPQMGLRYFLPKSGTEINLDSFTDLDEDEKKELCRMVIFDHIILGSMGITSTIYTKKDISEILNK